MRTRQEVTAGVKRAEIRNAEGSQNQLEHDSRLSLVLSTPSQKGDKEDVQDEIPITGGIHYDGLIEGRRGVTLSFDERLVVQAKIEELDKFSEMWTSTQLCHERTLKIMAMWCGSAQK